MATCGDCSTLASEWSVACLTCGYYSRSQLEEVEWEAVLKLTLKMTTELTTSRDLNRNVFCGIEASFSGRLHRLSQYYEWL